MASIYKRGKNWSISYKVEGKRVVKSLKTNDEKIAREKKKATEVDLKRGLIKLTHQKSIEDYLSAYRTDTNHRKPGTNIKEFYVVRKFLKHCNKKTINSIKHQDVLVYLEKYAANAPKTYNTIIITLKRFFRLAVKSKFLPENPADDIELKTIPKAPPKFFTDEEFSRIEKAAESEVIYPMIIVARYTGLRLRELLHLEWQDFDWNGRVINVLNKPYFGGYTTKNYKPRVVPICDELREKLLGFIKKEGLCFQTYGRWRNAQRYLTDGPKRQLHRVFKAAKIERSQPTGWHAFRHTFASRLAQEGTPLKKISFWLGHSSVAVTEIYAHIAPNYDEDIEKLQMGQTSQVDKDITSVYP